MNLDEMGPDELRALVAELRQHGLVRAWVHRKCPAASGHFTLFYLAPTLAPPKDGFTCPRCGQAGIRDE